MGDIKIYDIDQLVSRCKLKYFIETGTLVGDAIEYMRKFEFDRLISFEIIKELVDKATKRFANDKRIQIIHGDSSKALHKILHEVSGNTLFWLDAHFPGADIGINKYTDDIDSDTNLPLEREIKSISTRIGSYNDVIIIDDLWIYEDGDWEWGTFDSHMSKHGHSMRRSDICKGDSTFIRELFQDSHDIKTINKFQGSLVLIPKCYTKTVDKALEVN